MIKVSQIRMLILALSIAYNPVKAVDWEKVGVGACVVGGITALSALMWKICQPESDEHMLSRIEQTYDNTSSIMPYIKACETFMHIPVHSLHENQLHNILHTHLNNTDIAVLENKVQSTLNNLNSGKRELEKRIRENGNSKKSKTLETMETLATHISKEKNRIETSLKNLLDCHGIYFKAAQCYYALATQYTHEISVLKSYQYDRKQANFQIKSIISSNKNGRQYPFVEYYNDLTHNQEKLRRSMGQLSHAYPEIIYQTEQLLKELQYIRSMIAMSTEYTRDILQKEQDVIRESQKQLAAQQERFAREQEDFIRDQRRAQYELEIARITLAIEQIAFNAERRQELHELEKERKRIKLLINLLT